MPAFDPLTYRYASRRNVVYAKNAAACTSVPLGCAFVSVLKSCESASNPADCDMEPSGFEKPVERTMPLSANGLFATLERDCITPPVLLPKSDGADCWRECAELRPS